MTWTTRIGAAMVAVAAAAFVVRAEGIGSDTKGASRGDRLLGAFTVLPAAGGLVAVGGPNLRWLGTGATRWETLHTVTGDNLYRVASDDAGRLLAAWEKEPAIHFIAPAQGQHVVLPKPPAPGPDVSGFQISAVAFAPDGRDALVYMTGTVQVSTGRFRGPSGSTSAYRIALDGRSPARQIFRVDHAYSLHTSRFGAVFAMNKYPGRACDHRECIVSSIVAYELTTEGMVARPLFNASKEEIGRARVVRGSGDGLIALMLDGSQPRRMELLRWRFGDPQAETRTLPWPAREDLQTLFITKSGDLVELKRLEGSLEVWRHGAAGDERLAELRVLQQVDRAIHGVGERPDGGLWVHWGDHLGLLPSGKPPQSFSLAPLLPRRSEWTGDVYVRQGTEHLWVGIDGRGRDYTRVTFADIERRSKPWPAGVNSDVVGSGGEGAVTYAKDPSTKDRLYATTSLRPVPGGLISIGGPTLRRLPTGASRWETLHAVPGDSLYRVVADASGRLLAAWEKDPVIHLFPPGQGPHVTLPKPALPYSINGETFNAIHVDDLEFSTNGRDALVFMTGQVRASSRYISIAYLIALDGKSEPRQLFRVDQGCNLHRSRSGAVFVMPRDDRQECSHQTCWPVGAIVAYEIAGDRVTQRVLLSGDQVDMSRARVVWGSDDQRVGLVIDLVKRQGTQRRYGGRALLRWRWGEAQVDYRPLPGTTDQLPVWLLTRANELIEAQPRYGDGAQTLEIRRYLPGTGEQTTLLTAREPGATAYSIGERRGGGLWLHWGKHVVRLPPSGPTRALNIDPLMQRGWEWAGASVYVESPESLWVGLDGRGRQFARVDLADVERRGEIWR